MRRKFKFVMDATLALARKEVMEDEGYKCAAIFDKKNKMENHIKTEYEDTGNYATKCNDCFKKFDYKSQLNIHLKTVHQGIRPFECSECTKWISNLYFLGPRRGPI